MKLPLLAALLAHAAALAPKPSCARDQCFIGACERPAPASASADCKSFLQKTVSYCKSTSYTTTTVTVTASPHTVTTVVPSSRLATVSGAVVETSSTTITDTETVLVTAQATITTVDTISTFITDTETILITAQATITTDITNTVTATGVTTVTATVTNPNGPAKRSAAPSATTISPSRIPAYAAACGGIARYSSACSCHGVQPGTKTISGSTTVVTVTKHTTVTPRTVVTSVSVIPATRTILATSDVYITETDYISLTNTVTQTVLATSDVYVTETEQVSVTNTATITSVVTDVATDTVTAVSTSTITVQNSSPYFYLKTSDNRYISYDGSNSAAFSLRVDDAEFIEGQIDSQGRLNYGNQYYARTAGTPTGNDKINLVGSGSTLQCTLSNYAAGTGSFRCTAAGSQGQESVFNVCSDNYLYIGTTALASCQVVTLTAYAG